MKETLFKKLLVRILLGKGKSFCSLMKINGKVYEVRIGEWFDAAAWAKKTASALNLDNG